MPEAVEVELVRQSISKEFLGKKLITYNFLKGKFYKKAPPLFQNFKYDLCRVNDSNNLNKSMKLVDVTRKGKLLCLEFQIGDKNSKESKTWWVCNYFGLHGMYRKNEEKLLPNYDKYQKELNIALEFKDINNDIEDIQEESTFLTFYDTSGYGTSFNFFNNSDKYLKNLYKLAIDIFDDEFTLGQFIENFKIIKKKRLKRVEICCILINQGYLCSGIGNYMKCEILYEAELSPFHSINDLTNEQIEKLYQSIKIVSQRHLDANGKNQELMKVYHKDKDSNGNKVVYEKTSDGKKTYWVPEIQK